MSPLQFQKHRLQEARRLMLGEELDAASAGYRVGYGDLAASPVEYKRLFGAPRATWNGCGSRHGKRQPMSRLGASDA